MSPEMLAKLNKLRFKQNAGNTLSDTENAELQDLLDQEQLANGQAPETPVDPIVEPADVTPVESTDPVPDATIVDQAAIDSQTETPVAPETVDSTIPDPTPTVDPNWDAPQNPETPPDIAPVITDKEGNVISLEQVVQTRHGIIDQVIADLESLRSGGIPVNREFSITITKLEEALMWFAKSAESLGIKILNTVEGK